jgi:hypothetical protein
MVNLDRIGDQPATSFCRQRRACPTPPWSRTYPSSGASRASCSPAASASAETLQPGAIDKLKGRLDDQPILIMAPKPLLTQWQEELLQKLATPSARRDAGGSHA